MLDFGAIVPFADEPKLAAGAPANAADAPPANTAAVETAAVFVALMDGLANAPNVANGAMEHWGHEATEKRKVDLPQPAAVPRAAVLAGSFQLPSPALPVPLTGAPAGPAPLNGTAGAPLPATTDEDSKRGSVDVVLAAEVPLLLDPIDARPARAVEPAAKSPGVEMQLPTTPTGSDAPAVVAVDLPPAVVAVDPPPAVTPDLPRAIAPVTQPAVTLPDLPRHAAPTSGPVPTPVESASDARPFRTPAPVGENAAPFVSPAAESDAPPFAGPLPVKPTLAATDAPFRRWHTQPIEQPRPVSTEEPAATDLVRPTAAAPSGAPRSVVPPAAVPRTNIVELETLRAVSAPIAEPAEPAAPVPPAPPAPMPAVMRSLTSEPLASAPPTSAPPSSAPRLESPAPAVAATPLPAPIPHVAAAPAVVPAVTPAWAAAPPALPHPPTAGVIEWTSSPEVSPAAPDARFAPDVQVNDRAGSRGESLDVEIPPRRRAMLASFAATPVTATEGRTMRVVMPPAVSTGTPTRPPRAAPGEPEPRTEVSGPRHVVPSLPFASSPAGPLLALRALPWAVAPGLEVPARSEAALPAGTADQVVQALRLQWARGVGEAHIRLQPDQFGQLSVSLRVEAGQVVARLEATVPAVREWLQANQASLRVALADHHLELDRLEVSEPLADPDARRGDRDDRPREHPSDHERSRRQSSSDPTGARFEVVV